MFFTRNLLRTTKAIKLQQCLSTLNNGASASNAATKFLSISALVSAAAGLSYVANNGMDRQSAATNNMVHAEDVENLTSLSKKEFREFPVLSNKMLSKDTNLVTFQLPSDDHTLGMTVASCLSMSAEIDGKNVNRPYTPVSRRNQKGTAEFIIKSYPPYVSNTLKYTALL